MTEMFKALAAPCKSCPYRKDVPSGVWAASEYETLEKFDGSILEQALKGATGVFMCHQQNGCLCSGWLACHGPTELLALRLHADKVEEAVFDYETDVPVFSSGKEAAMHGLRDIDDPGEKACRTIDTLLRKKQRRAKV